MFDVETCVSFITNKSSKILADVFNEQLIAQGTTRVQWLAMYYLGFNPGISQKELAVLMNIRKSSITRLMDRMEKEGYAERCKDQNDRRITRIFLTETGKNIREKLLPEGEKMSQSCARDIPPEEIESFKRVLEKMVENVI